MQKSLFQFTTRVLQWHKMDEGEEARHTMVQRLMLKTQYSLYLKACDVAVCGCRTSRRNRLEVMDEQKNMQMNKV